jgi:hypothetical protein
MWRTVKVLRPAKVTEATGVPRFCREIRPSYGGFAPRGWQRGQDVFRKGCPSDGVCKLLIVNFELSMVVLLLYLLTCLAYGGVRKFCDWRDR